MTDLLPIDITARAASQIREAESWWRRNRPAAPNAIRQELERAFATIAAQPDAGGRAASAKFPQLRRIYLARVKYHVYYHVADAPRRVQVVAFWHTRRGDGPPL
ncbi:MAG: type II toxin-antitoxin system RelE/ParE family toxin [Acidobacteriota bacterium]|nr:type II toxin-antitoxin system RelE/ParE family toxin [Acidobacteriota bacterium]